MSIIVDGLPGRLLITKGAPENILAASVSYELEGRVLPLDAGPRANCGATYQKLSEEGFRTIAVAYRNVHARQLYSASDECELTFAGFLVFSDPPNPDSPAALVALRRAGVQLKILTGDNELVTRHVCGQIGIDGASVVLGEELDRMTDTALGRIVENTTVFARVSPRQKHRILLALKHRGHVVGYMGDGINDAPSLHAADVGISVANAVDVGRDAADMILLKAGLHVLQRGIIEGRRASANV